MDPLLVPRMRARLASRMPRVRPSAAAELAAITEPVILRFFVLDDLSGMQDEEAQQPLQEVAMDGTLWSELPAALQQQVLLACRCSSRARFRAVCKKWHFLLSKKTRFEKLSAAMAFSSAQAGYICGFQVTPRLTPFQRQVLADGPGSAPQGVVDVLEGHHKVHAMDLTFLPREFQLALVRHHVRARFRAEVDAWNGLVAVTVAATPPPDEFGTRICVFNPTNRTWRALPPLEQPVVVRGVAVDGGCFTVFAQGWTGGEISVYRSTTSAWTVVSLRLQASARHEFRAVSLENWAIGNEFVYTLVYGRARIGIAAAASDVLLRPGEETLVRMEKYSLESEELVQAVPWPAGVKHGRQHHGLRVRFATVAGERQVIELPVLVTQSCEVWEVEGEEWVRRAVLPRSVLGENYEVTELAKFYGVFGDVALMEVTAYKSDVVRTVSAVLAFHTVGRTWKMVSHLLALGQYQHHCFFKPRPSLDVTLKTAMAAHDGNLHN